MIDPVESSKAVARAIEYAEHRAKTGSPGRLDLREFLRELLKQSDLPMGKVRYIEAALLLDARLTFGGARE